MQQCEIMLRRSARRAVPEQAVGSRCKASRSCDGIRVSEDAMLAIANALRKAGVEFIEENSGGAAALCCWSP